MTIFIRALEDEDKEAALAQAVASYRSNEDCSRNHIVDTSRFDPLPGRPFAYWISAGVHGAFEKFDQFDSRGCVAQFGGSTKDDFRFLRLWWEGRSPVGKKWFPFAKGGAVSPFYGDIHLVVNWERDAAELEAAILAKYPYLGDSANWVLHKESSYGRPGITWTRRTKSRFSPRVLPAGCVFSEKGLSAFVEGDHPDDVFAVLAVLSSSAFRRMIEVQLTAADSRAGGAANSYEIGIINSSPMPKIGGELRQALVGLARNGWAIRRMQDQSNEASHAFLLPDGLARSNVDRFSISLEEIEEELNRFVAQAYELTLDEAADRAVIYRRSADNPLASEGENDEDDELDEEEDADPPHTTSGLLSWAVGVAFGRFDLRLATGERAAPGEPDPFDPLPSRSPGMLPETSAAFHDHQGVLVDDAGHPHDLVRLVEEVLLRVDAPVPSDLRRWLVREFFAFHLKRYSKSRRKAPIYWPLSTASGSYTLWVYYPSLTSQTLYTAINDFLDGPNGKLNELAVRAAALRTKGSSRTRDDERQLEVLHSLEVELIELRDSLLRLAPTYKPNQDDGVQISAAPLWRLFRHKPWQKVLKDTWAKLEKGEYDWAHLAMNYWPDRVREKCKTDKSLAIAHGLESLYVESEPELKKARGKRKGAEA